MIKNNALKDLAWLRLEGVSLIHRSTSITIQMVGEFRLTQVMNDALNIFSN